jgi:hypothetical protein
VRFDYTTHRWWVDARVGWKGNARRKVDGMVRPRCSMPMAGGNSLSYKRSVERGEAGEVERDDVEIRVVWARLARTSPLSLHNKEVDTHHRKKTRE